MCEIPTIYNMKVVKARKQHKCCECEGIIETGEYYNIHSGLWVGEWSTYKVCLDCEGIRTEADKDCPMYEGTPFEGLSETVSGFENGSEIIKKFVDVCDKRNGKVPDWLREKSYKS